MGSKSWQFILLMIIDILVLIASIFTVVLNEKLISIILFAYIVLVFISISLILLKPRKTVGHGTIEEFEKTLKGKLYHFKCQICGGIFAIKKSKHNNKKPFKLTCPNCGMVGVISPTPRVVEDEIPEKKSVNVNFKCRNCGEWIAIWAEGAEIRPNLTVYSCPYCGIKKPMKEF